MEDNNIFENTNKYSNREVFAQQMIIILPIFAIISILTSILFQFSPLLSLVIASTMILIVVTIYNEAGINRYRKTVQPRTIGFRNRENLDIGYELKREDEQMVFDERKASYAQFISTILAFGSWLIWIIV